MDFDRLTSEEAKAVLNNHPVALIALGAVENHGNHLPLGTDNDLAAALVKKVVASVSNVIVLPPIFYGQVWSLKDFPGTISISNETLSNLLVDIGRSLAQQGVKIFAIINGHMGNLDAMKQAARKLYEESGMKVLYLTYPGASEISSKVRESKKVHGTYFHACELETSYMLYLAPDFVKMEKAVCDYPNIPIDFDVTPTPWNKITTTAVLGDATLATREKGEAIIEAVVKNIVTIIESVRREVEGGHTK